jgi:hypothetical protein
MGEWKTLAVFSRGEWQRQPDAASPNGWGQGPARAMARTGPAALPLPTLPRLTILAGGVTRRMKPSPFAIALLLPLVACGGGGVRSAIGQIGVADPLRIVARVAPFEFGDTEQLKGRPAEAAEAAARIETFANAAETDPYWTHPQNATLLPQLQIARRELRTALGISPRVPNQVAMVSLGEAARALYAYNTPAAEAALAPVGGAPVLARLSDLPRLPRVEEAFQAMAIEANQPRLGQ